MENRDDENPIPTGSNPPKSKKARTYVRILGTTYSYVLCINSIYILEVGKAVETFSRVKNISGERESFI